jgi:hypothetical protein
MTGLRAMDAGCTTFHYCLGGRVVGQPMACPDSFMFDEVLGICNWPETVSCKAELCQPPTDGCCPNDGLRPYNGCESFFRCVNGQIAGVATSCAKGSLFDEANQICNWPSSFECGPEVCIIPTAAPISPPSEPPMTPPTPVTPTATGVTPAAPVDGPGGAANKPVGAPVGTSGVRLYELSLVVLPAVSVLLGLAF